MVTLDPFPVQDEYYEKNGKCIEGKKRNIAHIWKNLFFISLDASTKTESLFRLAVRPIIINTIIHCKKRKPDGQKIDLGLRFNFCPRFENDVK